MAVVSETIPTELKAEVDAALTWFNAQQDVAFDVTGIVDADQSLQAQEPRELRLVLCGGDLCQRQNFLVARSGEGFTVSQEQDLADPQAAGAEQSELDPPPGARRNWLESVLPQHSFTLLLFYRGFW